MANEAERLHFALRALMNEYRSQCLWFLRGDYYPSTDEEWLRVLEQIERHGDREAYRKTSAIKQWLSRNSSAASVGS